MTWWLFILTEDKLKLTRSILQFNILFATPHLKGYNIHTYSLIVRKKSEIQLADKFILRLKCYLDPYDCRLELISNENMIFEM